MKKLLWALVFLVVFSPAASAAPGDPQDSQGAADRIARIDTDLKRAEEESRQSIEWFRRNYPETVIRPPGPMPAGNARLFQHEIEEEPLADSAKDS